MESTLNLCRLCFVKVEKGINIFKKPKISKNFAVDLLDLLQISLEEKSEWPSGACKNCVDFIAEMRSFREKVLTTQETLLNVTPATESLPSLDDDYLMEHFSSDESVVEDKKEIKTEDICDFMEPQVIIEPLPELPTRRTSRVSKRPKIPKDTVNTFDSSSDEERAPPKKSRRLNKAEQQEEEEDKAAATYRQQTAAKKPRQMRVSAHSLEDLDLLVRRESRLLKEQRRNKRSLEEKEASLQNSVAMWDKKLEKHANLKPIIEEFKLRICDICKVEQESLGALFSHHERDHGIVRHKGYVVCCNNRFPNSFVLSHCTYHLDKATFTCTEGGCGKQCISKDHLQKHISNKHKEGNFKCSKCPRTFHFSSALNNHEDRHLVYTFNCGECHGMFETQETLREHVDFVHRKLPREICDVCGKGCKNYGELTAHKKTHTEIKTVSQCDICGLYLRDLAAHKAKGHKIHLKPCPECGKELSTKYLKRHMRIVHTKAKTFDCSVCQRQFYSKDTLKAHTDIHQGIRYPCQFCDMHYGSYRNRNKHLLSKHAEEHANFIQEKNLAKIASKYVVLSTEQDVEMDK